MVIGCLELLQPFADCQRRELMFKGWHSDKRKEPGLNEVTELLS